jgi:hypothetical protein
MTTLKIFKRNGFTTTISKQGGNIWIKAIKKIPLKTFKEEMSAQDILNLA